MDRGKANKILVLYERPVFKSPNGTTIAFARQDSKDIVEIEKMTDAELIEDWKGLVWTNEIYGQIDLNEMQRINLLELEIDCRDKINKDKLIAWFDKAEKEFDKSQGGD